MNTLRGVLILILTVSILFILSSKNELLTMVIVFGLVILGAFVFWHLTYKAENKKIRERGREPNLRGDENSESKQQPKTPIKQNLPQKPILPTLNVDVHSWKNEMINTFNEYKCLVDFLILKEPSQIFYGDLLNCVEWKFKRMKILVRDKYRCQNCGAVELNNHVHHTYYLQDKFPWDIDDRALETLCFSCHKNKHQQVTIPVYRKSGYDFIEVSRENPSCTRCGGTGYFPQYSHIENGVCFKCRGDLISKSVHLNILNITYRNIDSYNENSVRNRYKSFFNNFSSDDFIDKVPNYKSYILKEKTFEEEIECEYLPF